MKLSANAKRMVVERAALQRRAKEIMTNPRLTEYEKRVQMCDLASTNKYFSLKMLGEYIKMKIANIGIFMTPKFIAKNPFNKGNTQAKMQVAKKTTVNLEEVARYKMASDYIDTVLKIQRWKNNLPEKIVDGFKNLMSKPKG